MTGHPMKPLRLAIVLWVVSAAGALDPARAGSDSDTLSSSSLSPDQAGQVVREAVARFAATYVDQARVPAVKERILRDLASGRYEHVSSPGVLAITLTHDLREMTHDKHIDISYLPREFSHPLMFHGQPLAFYGYGAPSTAATDDSSSNFGFQRVELLDGNVGYLQLSFFAPVTSESLKTCTTAFSLLSHADALIIDVRNNGGGSSEMVARVISYLVDHPVHLITRQRGGEKTESWTFQTVNGPRFAPEKEVLVLISGRTFSGAEEFAFDLKNLRRGTAVGQRTGGGAHGGSGPPFNLGHNIVMRIPDTQVSAASGGGDWEGAGVTPDVEAPASTALLTAHLLALEHLAAHKEAGSSDARYLVMAIEGKKAELAAAVLPRDITPPSPDTRLLRSTKPLPAARALERYLNALNSGSFRNLAGFHAANIGFARSVAPDMALYGATGGFRVLRVVRSEPTLIEVDAQAKNATPQLTLIMMLTDGASAAPARIGLQRSDDPGSWLELPPDLP